MASGIGTYDRVFGAGPRGLLISFVLLAMAWRCQSAAHLPAITESAFIRWSLFLVSVIGAGALAIWSARSLPPAARGRILVKTGAFRLMRHPLYATLLSCFDFGLAVLLNNWIYVIWAVLVHALWHWNIRSEEALMRRQFPGEYEDYCRITGRFIPRLSSFRARGAAGPKD